MPSLQQAAADFRYLLNRGYPRRASLTLVGNRYDLPRAARQLLHRGVFADALARARRAKLRPLAALAGRPLAIDGHNVLITLESALLGRPLVAADDGFIRDVAQISRTFRDSPATRQALDLLAAYLSRHRPGPLTILYDAPMKRSGDLARKTRQILAAPGLQVEARAVPVPERELLDFPGAVATSDTHLIDAQEVLVDLAGEIVRRELAATARPVALSSEQ
uniref:DUF434 domain-containing protein n=1 Tax=Desulfobacca acetoxidans TaxID=60893 RepID=A0A7C3YZK1_9BACT